MRGPSDIVKTMWLLSAAAWIVMVFTGFFLLRFF